MALFFLILSFFFALWGAWEFFSVYFSEAKAADHMVAAMKGIALAVIPYLIGRSLSEMIAIRQRHLMLEQTNFQQQMMLEAMDDAAQQYEAESAEIPPPTPSEKTSASE